MYKKHSFEEKLRCMKLLDEGYTMRRLAKESGIRRNQLYDLRKRYLAYVGITACKMVVNNGTNLSSKHIYSLYLVQICAFP